jgi:hypothetical protein
MHKLTSTLLPLFFFLLTFLRRTHSYVYFDKYNDYQSKWDSISYLSAKRKDDLLRVAGVSV